MDFVDRLRQLIDNEKVSKVEIYSKLDIARGTLDNYLSGATSPTAAEIKKMTKTLDELWPLKTVKPKPKAQETEINWFIDQVERIRDDKKNDLDEIKQSHSFHLTKIEKSHEALVSSLNNQIAWLRGEMEKALISKRGSE